jgi:hypothetical protein
MRWRRNLIEVARQAAGIIGRIWAGSRGRWMNEMQAEDPKGLMREAYRIDGITGGECRTIFLDWALSLPDGRRQPHVIPHLLARYGRRCRITR